MHLPRTHTPGQDQQKSRGKSAACLSGRHVLLVGQTTMLTHHAFAMQTHSATHWQTMETMQEYVTQVCVCAFTWFVVLRAIPHMQVLLPHVRRTRRRAVSEGYSPVLLLLLDLYAVCAFVTRASSPNLQCSYCHTCEPRFTNHLSHRFTVPVLISSGRSWPHVVHSSSQVAVLIGCNHQTWQSTAL